MAATQTISLRDYAATRRFVVAKHCTQATPLGTLWAIGSSADDPEDLLGREGEIRDDGSWVATDSDFDPENLRKEVATSLTACPDEAEWDEIEEEYCSENSETRDEKFRRIVRRECDYSFARLLDAAVNQKAREGWANPTLAAMADLQGHDDMIVYGPISEIDPDDIEEINPDERIGEGGVDLFIMRQEGYSTVVTSRATPSEIRAAVAKFLPDQNDGDEEEGIR